MQTDARSRPKKWRWLLSKSNSGGFRGCLASHTRRVGVERIVSGRNSVWNQHGFGAWFTNGYRDDLAQLQVNSSGPTHGHW